MKNYLQGLASAAITVASLTLAVVLVHREFYAGPVRGSGPIVAGPPTFWADWEAAVARGRLIGTPTAKVKIVEFSDLECPVCRGSATTIRNVMTRHPKDVALVFVHFPLTMHRFALPAAHTSECATDANVFGDLISLLYRKQGSLGLKSWMSYAREPGVRDTVLFTKCLNDQLAMARVDSGVAIGKRIGIQGTPTVVVNGWRYAVPPSEVELDNAVSRLLAGKSVL